MDPPRRAPNSTPATERPIAAAISRVRIVPEAPTRVPATSSSVLCSTKPPAATVSPVKAFSSEMTIGTSAPPTGSTSITPRARPMHGQQQPGPQPAGGQGGAGGQQAGASPPISSGRAAGITTGRVVISS